MRLTILGSSASYASAGRACAGYLVESGGTSIVLDLGNGSLANLDAVTDPLSVAAFFVSHPHPDHMLDLYALQAMVRYAPEGPAPARVVHGPPGLQRRMDGILGEHGRAELADAFDFRELREGEPVPLGGLRVVPRAVSHVERSFALVVSDGASSLCYTGDARFDAASVAAARGADLLLADSTLPDEYAGRAPHMTPREAGALAREAGCGALVLTHLWPTSERRRALAEAAEEFGGPVDLAEERASFEVVSRGE